MNQVGMHMQRILLLMMAKVRKPALFRQVISSYLNTFKDSIVAMEYCECDYLPRILRYGEMYDTCSLIAPRSLLVKNGKKQ